MAGKGGIARASGMTGTGGVARPGAAGLTDMLASWLPHQRWFPGRGASLSELAVVSDVTLRTGDPALRHLIIETMLHGGPARFQVLVGYRRDLPPELAETIIGRQDGVACYDALHDPELADVLLRGITEQRLAEHLRFVREPSAPALATYEPGTPGRAGGRVLRAEQSNTSLVFGEQAILKVLRRLFPGANPDLEVADGLARLGSARVAAPYGWIETDLNGEPVLLAVLSEFLAGASDGWTLALAALSQVLPFTAQARLLGQATAELHLDMARAFGSRDMTAAELSDLTAAMRRALAPALRDVAGMLRSFDYAGRHQLIGRPADERVASVATDWVRQCQQAFCAGYATGGGADPDSHATLLRALTLEKAVYEVIYEYRHRPSWLPIPLSYLAAA
jgi:maltokinase